MSFTVKEPNWRTFVQIDLVLVVLGVVHEHKEKGYQHMRAYLKFNGSGKNAKLIQTELHRSKLPEIPVLKQLLQENIDLENDILESENDNKTLRQQNSDLSKTLITPTTTYLENLKPC